MTLRTIISRLRASIHEVSADTNVSSRYLWNVFYTAYTLILERYKNISNLDIYTTIEVEPILESNGDCNECYSCIINLDNPVELKRGVVIRYVGSGDLHTNFNKTTPNLFALKKENGFPYYYYEDGKIHLNKCLDCVKISYLSKFGKKTDSCSILDNELSIPEYLIHESIQLSLQEIGALNKPEDISTNKSEVS